MTLTSPTQRALDKDAALRTRAFKVVPGGMYGHTVVSGLWPGAPQFVGRAEGSHVWDVDGNEYVDLMCSWGPILHGHRHPKVEEAVARQSTQVDTGNGPGAVFVELAELFVDTVEHADWAMFAKNGSDVTTLALTIARAQTNRRVILVAEGAYHGALPWCNPNQTGVVASDREFLDYYIFNDLESVRVLAEKHKGDLAGVIVSAFKHDAGFDQALPDPEFARGLRQICDKAGAALILDDVRAGFRMALGASWEPLGVQPDLSAWSKGIGNGYPIAALLGSDDFRSAATSVFATGSFWMSAGPMAAALASIQLLRDEDGVSQMFQQGNRLVEGLRSLALGHGLEVNLTGPSTMPYLSFVHETDRELTELWASNMAARGVFLHPRHNWFISTALTVEDVERALAAADVSFAAVARVGNR